ncbi:MAG: hypothetical protein QOJ90_1501 [Actinomycetota bacterium]|jgi:hypothetical protein|nr:hypothetical protein [Actinomycetota bacterium]
MTLARWKDLCIDAADPSVLAAFWAVALDLQATLGDDGDAVLRGPTPEQTVWINRVPEPKVVKHRVHLDLVRPPLASLLAAGAGVLQEASYGERSWTVLSDPEGGELCLFAQPDAPSGLVIDSRDPVADAAWWADVLGARAAVAPGGLRRWVCDVPGLPFDVVKLVGVDEPKTVKNRVHWDLVSDDVPSFVARGARVLRTPDDEVRWHVLADPAGNEFCVFAP